MPKKNNSKRPQASSSKPSVPARLVQVISSDGITLNADVRALILSSTLATTIKELGYDKEDCVDMKPLPVNNVIGFTLKLVIEWCDKHKEDDPAIAQAEKDKKNIFIPSWDKHFLSMLPMSHLFDLITAAYHLDITGLINYGCKTVANSAKGKSTEEMRELFGIPEPWEQPSTSTATWDD
uniref:Skp1-related protein n=1 Tax=Caenorhabditis tropicalis TaxID=1561998 RepID=A0A1I7T4S6_9PELO